MRRTIMTVGDLQIDEIPNPAVGISQDALR